VDGLKVDDLFNPRVGEDVVITFDAFVETKMNEHHTERLEGDSMVTPLHEDMVQELPVPIHDGIIARGRRESSPAISLITRPPLNRIAGRTSSRQGARSSTLAAGPSSPGRSVVAIDEEDDGEGSVESEPPVPAPASTAP
jgi:hypothetical protein